MKDPKRLRPAILLCGFALALWPSEVAAQHRGRPVRSGGVDRHLAGTVDDFDGFLQRLDVPAGEHELALYLDGYRTINQKVLFRPGATIKISYAMEALPQGTPSEPRPQANPDAAPVEDRPAQAVCDRQAQADFGTLAVRVQPRDAAVFVDGKEWTAPDGPGPLLVELSAGSHEIEIRKQGFTSYRTTVRGRGNETAALNVSLAR